MASDSAAETFKGLSNVDWFAVVVVKCVNAPLVVADAPPIIVQSLKEGVYFFADDGNVSRWAQVRSISGGVFCGR